MDRSRSVETARIIRLAQRVANVSDAELASALGYTSRTSVTKLLRGAETGERSLTLEEAEAFGRVLGDIPLHVICSPYEEAFAWIGQHRPNLELVVDLTESRAPSGLRKRPSGWTALDVLKDPRVTLADVSRAAHLSLAGQPSFAL